MPDIHDGPISQGIRDAIGASGRTPYAIAKEVTQGGRAKLTGPQIYRFLSNKKGLSLAVLDEIARVLDVVVQLRSAVVSHVKETSPPEAAPKKEPTHQEVFHERLDRMAAIAAAEGVGLDERIMALNRAYNSIYRERLWTPGEVDILFDHLNELKADIRRPPPPGQVDTVACVNGIELTGGEDMEFINDVFEYDQDKIKRYLSSLRRYRPYVRKPPNLELSRRRGRTQAPTSRSISFLRPQSNMSADSSGQIADASAGNLEEDDDDDNFYPPPLTDSSFLAKLDQLRMPDGFEEGETEWKPKADRLDALYKKLLSGVALSPEQQRLFEARRKLEHDRIIQQSMNDPSHEWL